MQLFRIMGMPDRMIAFEELPKDLVEGFELVDESRLPRHWKDFIGIREKHVRIPPDRDPFTGTVRTYPPLVQKGPYSFVMDREINRDKEAWAAIESYVERNAPKDFRMTGKLFDMAKPMAQDAHAELSLEPEDVVIIPLPKEGEREDSGQASVSLAEPEEFKCEKCDKAFDKKQALRMHVMVRHAPAPVIGKA